MYRYELHLHTRNGSGCGVAIPADYVDYYRSRGYTGVVVTDHFYHGYTRIDRSLPWREFVRAFATGYQELKAAAPDDFDVFFGFEHRFFEGSDEYLILGVTPEWVEENECLRDLPPHLFFPHVHRAGGFIIQAHPYRERDYIKTIRLVKEGIDAIEVINSANEPETCRRALELARNLHLPMVGASDIHWTDHEGFQVSGIELPYRAHTVEQLIGAIRAGDHKIIVPENKMGYESLPLTDPTLPVWMLQGESFVETNNYYWN